VLRASPVARDVADILPQPAARASAAAIKRRPRSFSSASTAVKRSRINNVSTIQNVYGNRASIGIPQNRLSNPT
jgi:hypothetical protein